MNHRKIHLPVRVVAAAALAVGLWSVLPAWSPQDTAKAGGAAKAEPVQLMFVQTSEDIRVDAEASTLRLVNVNPQTLYFSDRPVRLGGHLKLDAYLR